MTEHYKFELEQFDSRYNMLNVGTVVWGYEPVTFEEIVGKK